MRVNHTNVNSAKGNEAAPAKRGGRVHNVRSGQERSPGAERAEAGEDVRTEISGRSREFARAKEIASGAPDVREDKIAELKRMISAGKYHVDADAIADRMVDDHLKMSGIG